MRKLSVLVRVLGHTKMENAFEVAVSGPEHFCEFDGADLSNGVNHCFERDCLEAHATVVEVVVSDELVGVTSKRRLDTAIESWPNCDEHCARCDLGINC